MLNRLLKFSKNIILSSLLLYAYDSFLINSLAFIPINFITILIVSIFGFPGLFCLILFSLLI